MPEESSAAQAVRIAADKARYDAACKRLLSEKVFLAQIMKDCVEEYKNCDVEDIIKYIEGQPIVGQEPVMPDESEGTQVSGMNAEDVSLTEGRVTYDILFQALVPGTESRVDIILNVEAQNKSNPGYPLIRRALYYCSRLISSQKGREFEHSHYERLKKVYSIWICANPPKDRRNTITRYQLTEVNQVGHVKEPVENYDLLSVVMVGLGGPKITGEPGVLQMLDVLLSDLDVEKKKRILQEQYRIQMTKPMEKEAMTMCNLSQGIEERGIKKGIEKGREEMLLESIKRLMDSLKCPADRAMELLRVPDGDREKFRRLINAQ